MNDTNYVEPLSDADFTELLIRHMILVPEVNAKARQLKVTGEDMVLDDTFGSDVYKELLNLVNSIEMRPIPVSSLAAGLKHKFDDGTLNNGFKENIIELIEYFYSDERPLEKAEWFDTKISAFIKKRRAAKLINQYKDDIPTLTRELNKLNLEVTGEDAMSRPRIVSPFASLLYKTKVDMIGTGIAKLDEKLNGGLLLSEYAMLIGFSGGGKTAVGSNMVGLSAEMGRPATYISCEEHETEISQRFYSRTFRIPYRLLRQGAANLQLESQFNDEMTSQKIKSLAKNLRLIGLKGVKEAITPNLIYELLVQDYEKTGFIPQLVMLDQLQFIEPDGEIRKSMGTWEIECMAAEELDSLTHRQIGGKYIVLWVQHQAKGKKKAFFTKEDIQGYKSIDNTADLVLGVGRANDKVDEINLFPIKVRHSGDFNLTLKTQFEFMTVTSTQVTDSLRNQESTSENPVATMTKINYEPIPHNPFA